MKFKKIMALMLVLLMALGMLGSVSAQQKNEFKDLDSDHWAYGAVKKMVDLGVLDGFNDGTFRPNDAVTREQFAKMMVASLKLDLKKPEQPSFDDVSKQYWAYTYIETAKPYLTGYQSGDVLRFKPTENAVREDMAVALVKALGYGSNASDTDLLDRFRDAEDISENVQKYVAIAVEKKLMSGSESGNSLYFKPQATLTRAEAAMLLSNVVGEVKVVLDEETKVVLDPVVSDDVKVTGAVSGEKITIRWEHDAEDGLQGFKIVASSGNSHPKYPDDGYMYWITDLSARSKSFDASTSYNGGDIGGKLKPGKAYYFSVTAVYDDKKIAGNAVKLTVPAEVSEDITYPVPELTGKISGSEVDLEWNEIRNSKFQGYKVVISSTNAHPVYPADGYYKYITDPGDTEVTVEAGDTFSNGSGSEVLKSGKTYYFSITALYDGKKVPGNTIRITLP